MDSSVGTLVLKVGTEVIRAIAHGGWCILCASRATSHIETCPLHGKSEDDLRKMVAVMDASEPPSYPAT